ncbi:MAG: DUF2809 domain-containing protein [Anaerocolumna sp.]
MILQSLKLEKRRTCYAVAFLIFLIIEVIIALYIHDTFVRPYIGDVLVAVVLYSAFRIFKPEGVRFLVAYIFLFAALVECLQFFDLIHHLKVENNTFLRVLIGAVFDLKDILCYGIGCILLGIFE